MFVDKGWNERGTKESLRQVLSSITRIDPWVLNRIRPLHRVAVAQRMSWASRRETTRTEDLAYCLLGIFGINMPLLYGERDRAFVRLQQAILQQTDDLSIFAWDVSHHGDLTQDSQLGYIEAAPFAPSPARFRGCEVVERFDGQVLPSPSTTITSLGVQLSACFTGSGDTQLLHLQCKAVPDPENPHRYSTLVLPLAQVPYGYMRRTDTFYAVTPNPFSDTFQKPTNICLVSGTHLLSSMASSIADRPGSTTCEVRFVIDQDLAPVLSTSCYPHHHWSPSRSCFYAEWSDAFLGAVEVLIRTGGEGGSGDIRCWALFGMERATEHSSASYDDGKQLENNGGESKRERRLGNSGRRSCWKPRTGTSRSWPRAFVAKSSAARTHCAVFHTP